MKTIADENFPEIEWELGDQYDDAGDGHVYIHHCWGESADGRRWSGSAEVCDGDFTDVSDVEEINP